MVYWNGGAFENDRANLAVWGFMETGAAAVDQSMEVNSIEKNDRALTKLLKRRQELGSGAESSSVAWG
jgi:hypothetical protein